jgi:hypothetical protein
MWNQMSEREQNECIFDIFTKMVNAGALSNRGRRNYAVLRGLVERKFGISVTMNEFAWEAKVDASIPKSTVSAAERNAEKIALGAAILGL